MKKLVVIMALAAALVGCDMSHDQVTRWKKRCGFVGGEPLYLKNPNGTVQAVRCVVDGATYKMGDY